MSDARMKDTFIMPLKTTAGGVMPFLEDNQGCLIAVVDDRHAEAIRRAVNSHDDMYKMLNSILNDSEYMPQLNAFTLAERLILLTW